MKKQETTMLTLKKILCVVCIVPAFIFGGCASANNDADMYQTEIYALDTYITMTLYNCDGEGNAAAAQEKISQLEQLLSVTAESSDTARINGSMGESTTVSEETLDVINTALEVSEQTDGALDISIYPVIKLWGFTTDSYSVPQLSELEEALALVDYKKINVDNSEKAVTLDKGMMIDLGAVAKGYIAGETAVLLKENGVESAVLSFGGNVQTIGLKPDGSSWTVGIKYPDTNDSFALLNVCETAVVTSAGDQRYFEEEGIRYSHIIDPSDGYPADSGVLSATVVCEDGAYADALSTALFVMGADKSAELYAEYGDFDYIILTENTVYVTNGIAENIELTDNYSYLEIEVVD